MAQANSFEVELHEVASGLPDGMSIFDSCGRSIFPLYGSSGGIVARFIFYVMEPGMGEPAWDGHDLGRDHGRVTDFGNGWKVYPIEINCDSSRADISRRLVDAVRAMRPEQNVEGS